MERFKKGHLKTQIAWPLSLRKTECGSMLFVYLVSASWPSTFLKLFPERDPLATSQVGVLL